MLKIINTLSNKKEIFKSIEDKKVRLYVCGITPYDYAHLGHGRVYVIFDTLYRLLTFLDYQVAYCRNFTDIDDKIITKALRELGDENQYLEISNKYIKAYSQDMQLLNCVAPTYEPRVTQSIPQIINFVQGLIDAGKAYVVNGNVYYHIPSFKSYGKLSKQKLDDLRIGARVEENKEKKDPLDFALWKSEPEGKFWKSPWGYGRPGWHIECSAMAADHLGEQLDIHAGGMDLIFPHHENEIAQTEGLFNIQFANYWMHNAFVRIDKEKMSKSLGNFFTLRDVFKQFDPMVVRFYYLNHHYRAPLDFSFDDLSALQKSYQRLCKIFQPYTAVPNQTGSVKESTIVSKMLDFLNDDLNMPGMFGVLFENIYEVQKNEQEAILVKTFLQEVLGLSLIPLAQKEVLITPEIEDLIAQRDVARANKDWKQADTLRDKLKLLGYDVQDKKL